MTDAKKKLEEEKKKLDSAKKKIEKKKKKAFNTLIKKFNRIQKSSLGSKKKYIKIVIDDADHYNYLKSFEENIKVVCERRKIPEYDAERMETKSKVGKIQEGCRLSVNMWWCICLNMTRSSESQK